mmetsp:Transcript_29136/g.63262  ORF Transcript_29136/g.63262 Transcript_29136/m.63262 type:complete len:247 (-) Transcript_29136:641-1381(-)|eukprot:CAMPEP_0206488924 /NCGR_PEP_ID=MMETSP0324_2-20121206/42778_1 /ASSEMBLY_ACC=CAM_ASM_000836 /TAXON_ID=2866 /ORGANISM="Crypthecodinium cohnii, Strain Seligo" /LENGTH=246 /DNA_ID=CAMNT_0053968193 /DNA_START=52 /DNA_END=792 /DNA_ORIENTATION=+
MASEDFIPNEEGQDLKVPLPKEWDLAALKTMPVTLYSGKTSPPSCKLRLLLKYYEVPFTVKNGKKPGSAYQKFPVLDIGDRQINDSFIIAKSLAPILQGRPYTPEELEIEREMTFGLMVAGEMRTAGSCKELCACGALLGGKIGCFLRCCSCALCCFAPGIIGKNQQLKSVQGYGDMLRDHLGSNQFLGGGDKPSALDLSVFGMLQPFARIGAAWIEDLLGPHGDALSQWYDRMEGATSHIDIFKA